MMSTVIWWRARDSNPVYPKVEDLQSPEVTNASRSPIWWTVPGSNRGLRLAKPLCSQLYQQPKFWRLVMESNHR